MIENVARHVEGGAPPLEAALAGAKQIGFTILSLTISLVAVLIPLLFMADLRNLITTTTLNRPKGRVEGGGVSYEIETNDQLFSAWQYKPLVVAYRNGAAVRLSDVATVTDSVEDVRNRGLVGGKPAIMSTASVSCSETGLGKTSPKQKVNPCPVADLEAEILRLRQALTNAQARWRLANQCAPFGVLEFDDTGGILAANPRAKSLLGLEDDRLLGRHLSDLVHPDDLDPSVYLSLPPSSRHPTGVRVERRIRSANGA